MVLKIIDRFYNFSIEVIRQIIINQYKIFHYNKYFLSSFCKVVFFMEIKSNIFDGNTILFTVCIKFDQNKHAASIFS